MSNPSTRLGNLLGGAMRAAAWSFDYALPLAAIRVYQLVPAGARSRLFGGPSASVCTAVAIRAAGGSGWQLVRIAASNHPERPPMPHQR